MEGARTRGDCGEEAEEEFFSKDSDQVDPWGAKGRAEAACACNKPRVEADRHGAQRSMYILFCGRRFDSCN